MEVAKDKIFGDTRANNVGATETTEAASAAEFEAADEYELETGEGLTPIWNCDQGACDECLLFDQQGYDVWGGEYPSGPTAHPNCRCYLTWIPADEFAPA